MKNDKPVHTKTSDPKKGTKKPWIKGICDLLKFKKKNRWS